MGNKYIVFSFGIVLLILMSACGPATATPTSQPPSPVSCVQTGCAYPAVCDKNSGQCVIYQTPQAPQAPAAIVNNHGLPSGIIVANNPNPIVTFPQYKVYRDCGEVQIYYPSGYKLYFDSSIQHSSVYSYPSGFPPDGMGQGFFGTAGTSFQVQECSGNATPGSSQCLNIPETFGSCPNPTVTATMPALVNPPGIGAGQLQPGCVPPAPSIDQISSFCANQSANIGGAIFVFHPSQQESQPPLNGWADTEESGAACQWNNGNSGPKLTCTGNPGTTMKVMVCSQCSLLPASQSFWQDLVCPVGIAMVDPQNPEAGCVWPTPAPNAALKFYTCANGSHFDNAQQGCVDDVSGKPVPGGPETTCPTDHPYYDVWSGMCSKEPLHQLNCQYFSVPVGQCITTQKKNACQPPAGGCGTNPLTGGPKVWNSATCSCQ
jgi:hypothetical protein